MSITETHPAPRRTSRPARDWVRCALLLIWVTLVLVAVLSGERQGRFGNLQNALAEGKVTEVTVRGEGMPEDSSGFTLQTVVWKDSWKITRQDQVRMVVGEEDSGSSFGGPALTGEGDLASYLQRTYPGVDVERDLGASSDSDFLGFHHLPGWTGLILLTLSLTVLGWIVLIPETWRLTRWGWFWVWLMLGPVGTPLFLLFGGPMPVIPAPKRVDRRISGLAVFLLCVVLSNVLKATWAARSW